MVQKAPFEPLPLQSQHSGVMIPALKMAVALSSVTGDLPLGL